MYFSNTTLSGSLTHRKESRGRVVSGRGAPLRDVWCMKLRLWKQPCSEQIGVHLNLFKPTAKFVGQINTFGYVEKHYY